MSQVKSKLLAIKDAEQKKALNAWKDADYVGTVIAGTGFGKSRVGVIACGAMIRKHGGRGLVLVPTNQLQDQFEEEFKKWGYEDVLDSVDILCYASAHKLRGVTYTVTVADEVHLGLSPIYREIFLQNNHKRLLCMTATAPEEEEYEDLLDEIAPTVYTITLDECVQKGLVAPYTIHCVPVPLLDSERDAYKAANNAFVHYKYHLGMYNAFEEAGRILKDPNASPVQKKNATLFYKAIRDRKEVVQKAHNKILYTAMIAKTKADKKILTFAGTNEFTNQMHKELNETGCNAARFHSALGKKEKDKALKDFRENEVRILCSTKALNQGFDVPDAQLGIICGLDSKALAMIQRVGRLLRLSPDKVGEVVILYVKDSQEEKWLRSSIESLSNIVWCDDISSYI
jgi:superfamily II DNA or RNA helicase